MSKFMLSKCMTTTHWLKISGLLLILVGTFMILYMVDWGEILRPGQITTSLQAAGPFGPILFILLMATAVIISPIPSLPLDLAAGATFGVTLGTMYAVIGAEIGAILSFLIGRSLGREAMTRIFRTEIRFCERCSDRHLAIFVFLARLFPIFSFDLVSYGAGLTNMSLRAFAVATLLGMIGPTFLLTYAGEHVVSGEWLLIVLGLAMVALLLFIPKLMVRYRTARWVRLLRGDMPIPTHIHVPPAQPAVPGLAIPSQCDSCGGPLS